MSALTVYVETNTYGDFAVRLVGQALASSAGSAEIRVVPFVKTKPGGRP